MNILHTNILTCSWITHKNVVLNGRTLSDHVMLTWEKTPGSVNLHDSGPGDGVNSNDMHNVLENLIQSLFLPNTIWNLNGHRNPLHLMMQKRVVHLMLPNWVNNEFWGILILWKASSCWESNPGHLPVLYHWGMTYNDWTTTNPHVILYVLHISFTHLAAALYVPSAPH